MYHPKSYREDSLQAQHALIRERVFGTLVTASPTLLADHMPLVLYEEGEKGVLRGHLAKANPQLQAISSVEECLVIFQGPQAYITPNWYPSRFEDARVAPTWNYVAVHAWGRPTVVHDREWLRQQIMDLVTAMEGSQEIPWSMGDAPSEYIEGLLGGIFGIEIPISRIEGKWKVSQNQDAENRAGVISGLTEVGELEMAKLVYERDPSRMA